MKHTVIVAATKSMRHLLLASTALIFFTAADAQTSPPPGIPKVRLGAPNGVPVFDQTAHILLADTARPPNQQDGVQFGYKCGDSYACALNFAPVAATNTNYNGDKWGWNGTIWENTQNAYGIWGAMNGGQADWQVVQPNGLMIDNLTAPAGTAYSLAKLRTAYAGNAATVWRCQATTCSVTGTVGFVGSNADSLTLASLCGPFPAGGPGGTLPNFTNECFIDPYDQSASALGLAPMDYGVLSNGLVPAGLVITTAGTGYTNGGTVTMTTTGGSLATNTGINGACVAPSFTVTSSGGSVTALTVLDAGGVTGTPSWGVCTTPPSNATAQTFTGGGGTLLAATVVWAPIYALTWSPRNYVNGRPTMVFNSQYWSAIGNFPAVYPISKYLRSNMTYVANEATMVVVGTATTSAGTKAAWTTPDGSTGGMDFATTLIAWPQAVGVTNKRLNTLFGQPSGILHPGGTPSTFIVRWNLGTVDGYDNNQYVHATGWGSSPLTSTTGFVFGSTGVVQNSMTEDVLALVAISNTVTATTMADIDQLQLGAIAQFGLSPQAMEIGVIGGASQSTGRGSTFAMNPFKAAAPLNPYPYWMLNSSVSGQTMAAEITAFATNAGDGQFYFPYARSQFYQYMGFGDDIAADCSSACVPATEAAKLSGLLGNWNYLVQNQAASQFYAVTSLCNGASTSCTPTTGSFTGLTTGTSVTLTPPAGVTCSQNPIVTVGSGATTAALPVWNVTTQGLCNGTISTNGTFSGSWTASVGTQATWLPQFLPANKPSLVNGTLPIQGTVFTSAPELAAMLALDANLVGAPGVSSGYAVGGSAASCSTTSACATLGVYLGAAAVNNAWSDPTVGTNSSGVYSAYNSSTWASGDGIHPTDATDFYIATGAANAFRLGLPFGP